MAVLVLPWTLFVFKLHPEDIGWKPYGWTEEDERREKLRVAEHRDLPGVPVSKALKTVPFVCMFLFAGLIAYFAGFNSHLPGFAQSVGFSAMVGSSLLTAVMVGNVVEKFIVGWLNDKIGVQFTVNIQLAMVALGFLGFILAGDNLVLLYVSAFLFGGRTRSCRCPRRCSSARYSASATTRPSSPMRASAPGSSGVWGRSRWRASST